MIKFIKGAKSIKDYPESKFEIVFIGRSNVGKSSLINALYGKVAYVGKTPGKTRILNFFNVDDKYTVCDVPGYGYANRSNSELIEFGNMMEEYFSKRKALKLCVIILDIRREPNQDDIDMINYIRNNKKKCLIIANKSDKVSNNQRINSLKLIGEKLEVPVDSIISVSCTSKTNIDILKETIIDLVK